MKKKITIECKNKYYYTEIRLTAQISVKKSWLIAKMTHAAKTSDLFVIR